MRAAFTVTGRTIRPLYSRLASLMSYLAGTTPLGERDMAADVLGWNAWYIDGSSHEIVNPRIPLGSAPGLKCCRRKRVAALPASDPQSSPLSLHGSTRAASLCAAWASCAMNDAATCLPRVRPPWISRVMKVSSSGLGLGRAKTVPQGNRCLWSLAFGDVRRERAPLASESHCEASGRAVGQ